MNFEGFEIFIDVVFSGIERLGPPHYAASPWQLQHDITKSSLSYRKAAKYFISMQAFLIPDYREGQVFPCNGLSGRAASKLAQVLFLHIFSQD